MRQLFCLLIALLASFSAHSQPEDLRKKVDLSLDNVARVNVRIDGKHQAGFAYLVSASPSEAVFVTARHVVASLVGVRWQAADETMLTTPGGQVLRATQILMPDDQTDIAVIATPLNHPMLLSPLVLADAPLPGEPVWIFGFDQKFQFVQQAGRVREITGEIVKTDGMGTWEGSSGAPVFSASGVVGIHTGIESSQHAQEVSIVAVRQIVESVGKAWQLRPSQWLAAIVQATFTRRDTLSLPVLARLGGGAAYAVPGQYRAPAGDYGLEYDMELASCIPQTWRMSRTEVQREVTVNCKPQLGGAWTSGDFQVLLTGLGDSDYSLVSVDKGPFPQLYVHGRIFPHGSSTTEFQATLQDLNGVPYTGIVKVSNDLKSLTLDVHGSTNVNRTLSR